MTEQKWSSQFDQNLNADQDLAILAQELHDADFSADSPIRHQLREDLLSRIDAREAAPNQEIHPKHNLSIRRKIVYIAAMLGMLALIVWFVPPLRSFAREVIRTIGNISITDEPTWAETQIEKMAQGTPMPTLEPTHTDTVSYPGLLPLTTVSEKAGFQALAPGYVPPGYSLVAQDAFISDSGSGVTIEYDYLAAGVKPGQETLGDSDLLIIHEIEWLVGAEELVLNIGSANVTDVTVRGQPGVWIEGGILGLRATFYEGINQDLTPIPTNILLWVENGLTFEIQTYRLPLDEVLKIAESLSTDPEKAAAEYQATTEAAAAQISTQVGYPVFQPEQLPADYVLASRLPVTDQGLTLVRTRYRKSNSSDIVDVVQIPLEHPSVEHLWALRNTERAQHATVNGEPAFWVELLIDLTRLELPPELELTRQGTLLWLESGYLFMIQSVSLQLDAMLQIANSMAQ